MDIRHIADWLSSAQVIVTAVIALAALFVHSPLGSKLPRKVAQAFTWISEQDPQPLFDKLNDLASSREARRRTAVDYVVKRTAGGPFPLTVAEAGRLVDWLQQTGQAAVKIAAKKLGQ